MDFIKYDHLYTGVIDANYALTFAKIRVSEIRGNEFKNKVMYLGPKYPNLIISDKCQIYTSRNAKLYINSGCKVPRDLFRNSGYKIVKDRENADVIVIPTVNEFNSFVYDIAVYREDTNSLYLFTALVNNTKYKVINSPTEDWEKIKQLIHNKYNSFDYDCPLQFFQDRIYDAHPVTVLPNNQDYIDMLEDKYPNRKYIEELKVPIDYPTTINIDTLKLWERRTDYNLLTKTICASDWKDYPVTLCYLIAKCQTGLAYFTDDKMKFVLDQIGYSKRKSFKQMVEDRVIEPKDWNMLQSYLLDKLGVPDGGGFAATHMLRANSIFIDSGLLRTKVAVAPLKINTPQTYQNIIAVNNNS